MKNKIEDLRNHMFEQLERLREAETPEQIKTEIERGKQIADIGKVIVDSAKAEVDLVKALKGDGVDNSGFFSNVKQLKA